MAQIQQPVMQGNSHGLFQVQQGNDIIVIREEGRGRRRCMESYKQVNGGNAGPILIRVKNLVKAWINKRDVAKCVPNVERVFC